MAKFLFDLDGVLVRSRSEAGAILWSEHVQRDLDLPAAVIKSIFTSERWHLALVGKADVRDLITDTFLQHGIALGADTFLSYWLDQDRRWYPNVLQLISNLKANGHLLSLATNQEKHRRNFIATQAEVHGLFDGIFASSDLGVCKPNIEFYRYIQKIDSRFCGNDVVVIDDDSRNIEAAGEVGFHGICFNPDAVALHTAEWLEREISSALE